MMNLKKVLAGVLAGTMAIGCMGVSAFAAEANNSDSKWATSEKVEETATTTEGILFDFAEKYDTREWKYTYNLTYTIPADFTGADIHLNIVDDMNKYYADTYGAGVEYQPGDNEEFVIFIKNESDLVYSYVKNSFEVSSAFDDAEDGERIAFDGTAVNEYQFIYRNRNSALKDLFGTSSPAVSDANIIAQWEKKGLSDKYKSIDDLDEFYLDYINNKFNKSYTRLEQATDAELHASVLDGIKYVKETNDELNTFGYNYFYNAIFFAIPSDQVGKLNYNEDVSGVYSDYTLGAWMRADTEGVKAFENAMEENLSGLAKSDEAVQAADITLHLSGPYCANAYQSTAWCYNLEMDMVAETAYTVVHNYYTSTNGAAYALDGTVSEDFVKCLAGDAFDTEGRTVVSYNGNEYTFNAQADGAVNSIVAVADANKNVLVLNYFRSVNRDPEVEADTEPETETETKKPEVEADEDVATGDQNNDFVIAAIVFGVAAAGCGVAVISKKRETE